MDRILITSGPTRQYLDPVRYLTNASSGQMGCRLAEAAITAGHEVVVISGPVGIEYPSAAEIINVVSTEEMLAVSQEAFEACDGLIGVAAPCDYRPRQVQENKIKKTGEPLRLELIETDDVVATLGKNKGERWMVGFALETDDQRLRALAKLEEKSCDLIILNGPEAMNATETSVEVIASEGRVLARFRGTKADVSRQIFQIIQRQLIL
ncbi:MAG TPA: phosphopantothenoylcysteine decarboxylase [Pirellulales bacterium]|nr:phosphopantothenoylcysteine decarboxylase [Pirellulales bacterium]